MDTGKFWLFVWVIIGITFLGTVYLTTNYWNNYNTKVVNLIAESKDPLGSICALQDDYGNHPTCIILATKRKYGD
jgi:hypothetical protein